MQTVSRRKGPILETLAISVLPDFLAFRPSLRCCKLLNYLIIADSHRGSRRLQSLPVERSVGRAAPHSSAQYVAANMGHPPRTVGRGLEMKSADSVSNLIWTSLKFRRPYGTRLQTLKAPALFLPCWFVGCRSSLLVRQLRHRHPLVPWSGTGSVWGRSEHQQSCPGLQDMGALHCEQNAFMVGAF
jgi:hypothetical protein